MPKGTWVAEPLASRETALEAVAFVRSDCELSRDRATPQVCGGWRGQSVAFFGTAST